MLIEAVAKLPQMAIWVVVMFWAYKVVVIGSLYGLIRFVVLKAHNYLITQKTMPVKTVDVRHMIEDICIAGQPNRLIEQLRRVTGRGTGISSNYLHRESVDWLRDAIDDKISKEMAEEREKQLAKAKKAGDPFYLHKDDPLYPANATSCGGVPVPHK